MKTQYLLIPIALILLVSCKSDTNSVTNSGNKTQSIVSNEPTKAIADDIISKNTEEMVIKKETLTKEDPCSDLLKKLDEIVGAYLKEPNDSILNQLFKIQISKEYQDCREKNALFMNKADALMELLE